LACGGALAGSYCTKCDKKSVSIWMGASSMVSSFVSHYR
jgi:hypothetical protein